ncbi:DUF115 domain-containing protein [Guyparkeria halophila]|uniref:DUF115 domain-containing protein n=1 Tax=Guyparkeria halophila TaxID=47960 RepID=A0A6I6CVF7_9GAMM|nr:6-hydroxymethylpterin diphosphokinase MptE-like protein [Guyparkeria halophila]QGT78049.1 DUF115 domain-containing protein [Guyparkeria halophila]
MTTAERSSRTPSNAWESQASSPEWLQTQQGDWILPSLNARHFGSIQVADQERGASISKSHAQTVLKEHFGDRLHQEDQLYVVIGSDSGQLLRYIREHAPLPRGSRWLVIEPEDVLRTLRQNPSINALCDDFVQLVGFDEWQERATLLQLAAYFRIDGVRLERSLAALDGTDQQYIELTTHLDAHLTAERFRKTAELNLAPFIAPNILSAPNFHGGIDRFENLFPGRSTVIIAGGPSLDDQIGWLLEHRDALFIIAVSRVSGRLQDVGITPDIVVTVDPFPISLTVSRQMFDFPEQTVLIASSHPYPRITNRWPHSLFCTGPLVPWPDEAVNDRNALSSAGPTVTHMAAQLAVHMGFKEVIFCGLDLCHTPDGRTHASGSGEAAAGPIMDFSAIPVVTNNGDSAWTTPDYFAGIQAMTDIAQHHDTVRFVNPSAKAAAIGGIEHVALKHIVVPTISFDRTPLDRIRHDADRETRRKHLNALAESLETIEGDLHKVANLAQLGLESNQAYFNLTHPTRQKRHKRRMQAIDRLFEGRFRRAARLAQQAAKRAIMRTALPHDFFALDRRQAENLASQYYDAIREQARRLTGTLELARERVATRLLELDDDAAAEKIAIRYTEYDEPERVHWLEVNRAPVISSSIQQARLNYATFKNGLLERDQERYRRQRSPRSSLRQIERLFSSKKKEALAQLADSLVRHHQVEIAQPYAHYANGLKNELENDLVMAAEEHTKVIQLADMRHDIALLEHALLRLTDINLEAREPAASLTALQAAARINPSHWRLVARLALLENDAETGITALTRHLEQFPGDVERIKQMVRLFVALEIPDGIPFCEQYLPYCAPAARLELEAFLKDARNALESPGESS